MEQKQRVQSETPHLLFFKKLLGKTHNFIAMLRSCKNPEESKYEGLIGEIDSRKLVDPIKTPHHKAVGFLKLILPSKVRRAYGTAFLISPFIILTAAHNLEFENDIIGYEFYPAAFGEINIADSDDPQGKPIKVIGWKFDKNFRDQKDMDFAVMILEQKVYLDEYPAFSLAKVEEMDKVHIIGYPAEKQHAGQHGGDVVQPYIGEGQIIKVKNNCMIWYKVDTSGGQSGSPIFAVINGLVQVVGVHNGSSSSEKANRGVHIDEKKLVIIKRWQNQLLDAHASQAQRRSVCWLDRPRDSKLQPPKEKSGESPLDNLRAFFQFRWELPINKSRIFKTRHAQLERIKSAESDTIEGLLSEECFETNCRSVVRCEVGRIARLVAVGVIWIEEGDVLFRDQKGHHLLKLCEAGFKLERRQGDVKMELIVSERELKEYSQMLLGGCAVEAGDVFGFQLDTAKLALSFFKGDQLILEIFLKPENNCSLYLLAVMGAAGDSIFINRLKP